MKKLFLLILTSIYIMIGCGDFQPVPQVQQQSAKIKVDTIASKETESKVTSEQFPLRFYTDARTEGESISIQNTSVLVQEKGHIVFLSKEDNKKTDYNTLYKASKGTITHQTDGTTLISYLVTYDPPSKFSFLKFPPFQITYAVRDTELIYLTLGHYTYYTEEVKANEVR